MNSAKRTLGFINLVLYDLLLILTPFLLIRNYLQLALKELSQFKLHLFFFEIPLFVFVFLLLSLFCLFIYWKKLKAKYLIIILLLVFLMVIGQNIADFYLDYSYYDLQNNWHYFAYGIFVFIAYRYFKEHIKSDSKLITIIFLKAFIISSIDEGIQVFISNRIFDVSDIAKDLWGVCLGLVVLLFWVKDYNLKNLNFIIKKAKDYFSEPVSILLHLFMLTLIFLLISSNLTDSRYFVWIILWTLFIYLIYFIFSFICKFRYIKILTIFTILLIFGFTVFNFISVKDDIITQKNSMIYYKNIPLFFFDFMVFPNGLIRMTDKKSNFRGNDFIIFKKQNPDLLIISSDKEPYFITGFEHLKFVEFPYLMYNEIYNRLIQVLILKQEDAIRQYNRLNKLNKKVLLVIHQSL